MTTVEYLLIDDAELDTTEQLAAAIRVGGSDLQIEVIQPPNWTHVLLRCQRSRAGAPFGLILDQRLDDGLINRERRDYRGSSLAQEIRNRGTDDDWKQWSYPIVLLSMPANLERSYEGDSTVQDLFDAVYSKDQVGEQASRIAVQLVALARGYTVLRGCRRSPEFVSGVLGITDLDEVSAHLGVAFPSNSATCHDVARFVLHSMLEGPGALVPEALLAVRLGVSTHSPGWPRLRDQLADCRYTGVFAGGWPRWWFNAYPVVPYQPASLQPPGCSHFPPYSPA